MLKIKISNKDLDLIKNNPCFIWKSKTRSTNYVVYDIFENGNRKRIFLAREIAKRKGIKGPIYFKDKNSFNLKRNNIISRRGLSYLTKNNTSGYKNIYSCRGGWQVSFKRNGKSKYIGFSNDINEAIRIAEKYRKSNG